MKAWIKGLIVGIILFIILNVSFGIGTRGLQPNSGDYFFLIKSTPVCPDSADCSGIERVSATFLILKIIIFLALVVPIIIGWMLDKKRSRGTA